MTQFNDRPKAIPFEKFQEELKRRGGGGDPGGEGPDPFRVFRDKAQSLRNSAKGVLRPLLPPAEVKSMTPALETFNRIAAGGFGGTVAAIRVLVAHKMQAALRHNA